MALVDTLSATLDAARRQADRVVAPNTRHQAYSSAERFARQQPLLFSFVTTQLLFALLPLLLFSSFALATTLLACASALSFVLFWTGLAALVLGAALCVSFTLALCAWTWLVGGFLVARWLYGAIVAGREKGHSGVNGVGTEARCTIGGGAGAGGQDGHGAKKVVKREEEGAGEDGADRDELAEKSKSLANGGE